VATLGTGRWPRRRPGVRGVTTPTNVIALPTDRRWIAPWTPGLRLARCRGNLTHGRVVAITLDVAGRCAACRRSTERPDFEVPEHRLGEPSPRPGTQVALW
jgi:hypothetical protein